jgi:hypothetical protein
MKRMARILINLISIFILLFLLLFTDALFFLNEPHDFGYFLKIAPDPLSSDQIKFRDLFYSEAQKRGIKADPVPILKISSKIYLFGKLIPTIKLQDHNIEGICFRHNYPKAIVIAENSDLSAIFHELGHCVLNRSHDNNLQDNGLPRSLMFSKNQKLLDFNYNYYLNELFNSELEKKNDSTNFP